MAQADRVDLHLHSTESDGRLTPTELVELAHRNGVRHLALTDDPVAVQRMFDEY